MTTKYFDHLIRYSEMDISMDLSKLPLDKAFLDAMQPKIAKALADIQELESGAIANPDEERMVGHYWLREPSLAPTEEIGLSIIKNISDVLEFSEQILECKITPPNMERFSTALIVGIGGSALGPELIADALTGHFARGDDDGFDFNDMDPDELEDMGIDPEMIEALKNSEHYIPTRGLELAFLDNTDPNGICRVLDGLHLPETLVVVISKSGGTAETRNGMIMVQNYFKDEGLDFAKHAVAITGVGSKLDKLADKAGWLRRFPMEDWVGGRTSVTSVVGLLPAALQGIFIPAFLAGAAEMDKNTRSPQVKKNMALSLALAWYKATNGKGEKDMVVLPYKDSLVLFSKYLQQLIMESIGKKFDIDGKTVHQGLTVYGNKGSTDQHAYVQQLRDGIHNFFATFIEVHQSDWDETEVEPGITCADYLQGFLRGTRQALSDAGRESITISIDSVNEYSMGALIALFERAVSFYASLVNINAYHQPGVEAGKKAAGEFIDLLKLVTPHLKKKPQTAAQIAAKLGKDEEDVYHALVHLSSDRIHGVWKQEDSPQRDTFSVDFSLT